MCDLKKKYKKQPPKKVNGSIILRDRKKENAIPLKKMLYLKAERTYTFVFLKNDHPYCDSKNIKLFEDVLKDFNFFRIHKSFIVNLAEIETYRRDRGGKVILSDGTVLPVAQNRKTRFVVAWRAYVKLTRSLGKVRTLEVTEITETPVIIALPKIQIDEQISI